MITRAIERGTHARTGPRPAVTMLRGLLLGTALALVLSSPGLAETAGFSISVDGEHVAGDPVEQDAIRQTDLALEELDIQVKFDGLGVEPVLNVSTDDCASATSRASTSASS